MLYCVECGCCSGELGKGWVAFRCDDPEDDEGPEIAIWCPICAAEEFGYRPEVAATYVRGWDSPARDGRRLLAGGARGSTLEQGRESSSRSPRSRARSAHLGAPRD